MAFYREAEPASRPAHWNKPYLIKQHQQGSKKWKSAK